MKKSSVLGGLAFAAILGSVFTFPVYAKEKTFPEGIYAGGFAPVLSLIHIFGG